MGKFKQILIKGPIDWFYIYFSTKILQNALSLISFYLVYLKILTPQSNIAKEISIKISTISSGRATMRIFKFLESLPVLVTMPDIYGNWNQFIKYSEELSNCIYFSLEFCLRFLYEFMYIYNPAIGDYYPILSYIMFCGWFYGAVFNLLGFILNNLSLKIDKFSLVGKFGEVLTSSQFVLPTKFVFSSSSPLHTLYFLGSILAGIHGFREYNPPWQVVNSKAKSKEVVNSKAKSKETPKVDNPKADTIDSKTERRRKKDL